MKKSAANEAQDVSSLGCCAKPNEAGVAMASTLVQPTLTDGGRLAALASERNFYPHPQKITYATIIKESYIYV